MRKNFGFEVLDVIVAIKDLREGIAALRIDIPFRADIIHGIKLLLFIRIAIEVRQRRIGAQLLAFWG